MANKSSASRWCHITTHALEQFVRRWAPDKSQEEAKEELAYLLDTSRRSGKTAMGHPVFISGHRPEIRMVIKDYNVCVTILPPDSNTIDQEEATLLAQYQEEKRIALLAEIENLKEQSDRLTEQRKQLGLRKNELMSKLNSLQARYDKGEY